MYKKLLITVIAGILLILLIPGQALAAGISLDGSFEDWADKPRLTDTPGDEIMYRDLVDVRWFADASTGNLYLYCERQGGTDYEEKKKDKKRIDGSDDRFDDSYDQDNTDDSEIYNDVQANYHNLLSDGFKYKYWLLTADFSSDLGSRKAYVFYHPPSRKVIAMLFDQNGKYIWSANGKWGEGKETAKRIEFGIPVSHLVSSMASGYQINLYFTSGSDRAPDRGNITISTVSTFPMQTTAGAAIICLLIFLVTKKGAVTKAVRLLRGI